jgi:hypothetical protein
MEQTKRRIIPKNFEETWSARVHLRVDLAIVFAPEPLPDTNASLLADDLDLYELAHLG